MGLFILTGIWVCVCVKFEQLPHPRTQWLAPARCVWGAVNLRVPRYCGKNVIKVVDVMDILFGGEKRLLLVSVFGIIVLF